MGKREERRETKGEEREGRKVKAGRLEEMEVVKMVVRKDIKKGGIQKKIEQAIRYAGWL